MTLPIRSPGGANLFPLTAIALLSAISFMSTFHGMHRLMEGDDGSAGGLPSLIAFGFTLSLQLILVWAVWQAVHGERLTRRLLALLLYGVTVLLSVGFGYGFWFEKMRSVDHGVERFRELAATLAEPAVRFGDGYDRLVETQYPRA